MVDILSSKIVKVLHIVYTPSTSSVGCLDRGMAHRVKLAILSNVRFFEVVHSYSSGKLQTKKGTLLS